MTVGNQTTSHFFAQQMGRSHAPHPCRSHHGHPPQNQRIFLLCVMDHSSGHTEEWESLTPTRRATPKHGCPVHARCVPGALTYSQSSSSWDQCRNSITEPHCPARHVGGNNCMGETYFFWLRPRCAGVACSLYGTQDNLSELRFRAVQCYDDPTNDCGSGSNT